MKIAILPQEKSSIIDPIELELGNYTILAGKNNSGKTSIANAIVKDHKNIKELNDYRIIFIPADRIQPDQETKVGAKSDPFYAAVAELLAPIFSSKMMDQLKKDFTAKKAQLVKGVNKILKDSGVDDTELDVKLKDIEEALVIKLAKAFAKDLYKIPTDEIDLNKIGTGAQRMILAALIRFYAENRPASKGNNKTLLIIEEPELCLHPEWKEKLRTSLEHLVVEGVLILVTTHDPYFVKFGNDCKIYEVARNPKNDATEIREQHESPLLGYPSDAEINYLIFDVLSNTYFLELYEKLSSLIGPSPYKCQNNKCGKEVTCSECGQAQVGKQQRLLDAWAAEKYALGKAPQFSLIRNSFGHPDPKKCKATDDEIRTGIIELRRLIAEKRANS